MQRSKLTVGTDYAMNTSRRRDTPAHASSYNWGRVQVMSTEAQSRPKGYSRYATVSDGVLVMHVDKETGQPMTDGSDVQTVVVPIKTLVCTWDEHLASIEAEQVRQQEFDNHQANELRKRMAAVGEMESMLGAPEFEESIAYYRHRVTGELRDSIFDLPDTHSNYDLDDPNSVAKLIEWGYFEDMTSEQVKIEVQARRTERDNWEYLSQRVPTHFPYSMSRDDMVAGRSSRLSLWDLQKLLKAAYEQGKEIGFEQGREAGSAVE